MPIVGGYTRSECRGSGGTWVDGAGCEFPDKGGGTAGPGGPMLGAVRLPKNPGKWFDKGTQTDRESVFNMGNGIYQVQYEDGTSGYFDEKDLFPPKQTGGGAISGGQAAQIGLGYAQLGQSASQFAATQAQQSELSQAQLGQQWKMFQEQFVMDKDKFNATHTFNKAVQNWQEATDARNFKAAEFWKTKAFEFENIKFEDDKRRFGLQFAENQRQFDTSTLQSNADRDVRRGQTLLGLGSRPDTLMRYLYALRGKETPQGLDTPPDLPGFGPTGGQNPPMLPRVSEAVPPAAATPQPPPATGGGGGTAPPPVVPPAGAPPPATPQILNLSGTSFDNPGTTPNEFSAPMVDRPANLGMANIPTDAKMALGPNNQAISLSNWMVENLKKQGVQGYAKGGVIPEPVIGVGQESGQTYTFGEEGPEGVVPNDVFERLMKDADEVEYSEGKDKSRRVKVKRGQKGPNVNSFAAGGTIGYDPSNRDFTNSQAYAGKFNNRPVLPSGVPNFPQVNHFTQGGGLIPSLQRMTQASPTERSFYSGYLRDVEGVQSDDVFEAAQRLGPQVGRVRTPRYVR